MNTRLIPFLALALAAPAAFVLHDSAFPDCAQIIPTCTVSEVTFPGTATPAAYRARA